MQVLEINTDSDGYLVNIQDGEITVCVQVWARDNYLLYDWNKYIFQLKNENDMQIKAYQETDGNLKKCGLLAISAVENLFTI